MNRTAADADAPDLSVRVDEQQAVASLKRRFGYLERAAIHVDGDDFPVVAGFDRRSDFLLIHFLAASGVFLNGVARLPDRHDSTPLVRVKNPCKEMENAHQVNIERL
jgi:hypothetical protein